MILKDIVYTIWRELEGGYIPDDTRFTYKNIRTVVVGAIGEAALELSMRLRNADPDDPYPTYYNEYQSEVKYDAKTNNYYAELKGKPITFNGTRSYDVVPAEDSFHLHAIDFLPTTPKEWFSIKKLPRIPSVIHYLIGTKRINFMSTVDEGSFVTISQGFSVPTAGGEEEDLATNIPDELGRTIITNSLVILRDQLRPSDRANDGVPIN